MAVTIDSRTRELGPTPFPVTGPAPVGPIKAVAVAVVQRSSASAELSDVAYGGEAMGAPEVSASVTAGDEDGRVDWYTLGGNDTIPSGQQSITATDPGTSPKNVYVFLVAGAMDGTVTVSASGSEAANQEDTDITLGPLPSTLTTRLVLSAIHSGRNAPGNLDAGSGFSLEWVDDRGSQLSGVQSRDAVTATSPVADWDTGAVDDIAHAAIVFDEAIPSITLLPADVYVEIAPAPDKWESMVQADAPAGWWRFGLPLPNGDMADETANANDAIPGGVPSNFANVSKVATHCKEVDNRRGGFNSTFNYYNRYEGAFDLDGTADRWRVPDDAAVDVGSGDFTLEVVAWWSPIGGGFSGWRYVVWKGGVSGAGYYLRYNYTTKDLQFGIHDGTTSATATWSSSTVDTVSRYDIASGVCQHVIAEKIGSTIRLVVNGTERASTDASSVSGSLSNGDDLYFGSDGTPANFFADHLDEIALYTGSNALTSSELADHYAATRWIAIEEDLIREKGFRIKNGKAGGSPTDLVASPGLCVFSLDNSDQNLVETEGYYSPGHSDALANFGDGTRVRVGVDVGLVTQWVFAGAVKTIEPSADPREPFATITCGDFFYDALEERVRRVPAYEDQRADDIFEQLVDSMESRPVALRTYQSDDVYPIVFDDLPEEDSSYLRALQSLAQSDYAHMYTQPMDSLNGEAPVVVFEPRNERLLDRSGDLAGTITSSLVDELVVTREKANVINHVDVTYRRRVRGDALVVVASLRDDTPGAEPETAIPIAPGETYLFHLPYTNPDDRQQRVGSVSVEVPTPTTDYEFYASQEGTGIDLTGSLTIVNTEIGVSSIAIEARNDASTLGYITKFDVQGVTVIADEPTTVEQVDAVSVALNGQRPLTPPFAMFYQPNGLRPSGLAAYIRLLWADQFTDVKSVRVPYFASLSTAGAPFVWFPGVRLDIVDVRAGIDQRFFIQGADIEIVSESEAWVTFNLMPSHPEDLDQWVLEDATKSILETSTYASYF